MAVLVGEAMLVDAIGNAVASPRRTLHADCFARRVESDGRVGGLYWILAFLTDRD